MRFHNVCSSVMLYLDEMTCFLAAEYSFWWCGVRAEGGKVEDMEGCGRLSVHDGLLDVARFLCVEVGWFVGQRNDCKFYGGAGGGWWKYECVGRQKNVV